MRKFLQIVEIASGKVEREFDLTGKSERECEKIETGLLRNMSDEFFTRVVEKENAA